jgi:KDO2-lipid IV(A) lauroyltransferase
MIAFLSYKIGAALSGVFPVGLSLHVASLLAGSQYRLRPGSRRSVLRNIRTVTGLGDGPDAQRLARGVFSNFGRSIYSFLRLPLLAPDDLRRTCDYAGLDALVEDLRRRGGFVIAGPHVGPWEMAGACLSALGLRVHTVALDHPSRGVTEFFDERRCAAGIVCHPIGKSFPALAEALERGECVALLVDRAYGRARRSYTMFGREVSLPTGHAALAVRCRVPVVSAVCVFDGKAGLRFVYRGPHYPDPSRGEEAALEALHGACRRDMEEFIRTYPDQWFHFTEFGGENG